MSLCPCGSERQFDHCCQPIIQTPTLALKPEQLMRSRYTAHCIGDVDYIINTYHPSCGAESHREGIAESVNSQWLGLQIIDAPAPGEQEGFVHFIASWLEAGKTCFLEERSRFVRHNGQWYYIDGIYPEHPKKPQAIGRNDNCPCGSEKKFKKCCGR